MNIKVGNTYIFTKSGNKVRVLTRFSDATYEVERVDNGKKMIVSRKSLQSEGAIED